MKKRKTSANARIAAAKKKIAVQRRRAARPMLAVNTHAPISETLEEKKRRDEQRRIQRRDWENL